MIEMSSAGSYSNFGNVGAYGGADLSTVEPNPSVDDYAATHSTTDISAIMNTAGQWGSTIASIVTGNPVAVAPVPGGGYQPIGVAGSYSTGGVFAGPNSTATLLLLGIGVVVLVLLLKK